MADLRIVDAPEIPTENITGEEKLPTGGNGNYSISLDSLADYTKTKKDLADNTSVDGKVNGVRQELDTHIEDLLNPHQVTKGQIGLGNVDNTADADKPVSNSTQAAIISAVSTKADKSYVDNALSNKSDKTYVDNQLAIKANKSDVYTKLETYTKQESSDLVNSSISTALTPVNTSLDLAKRGIANSYDSSLTYNSGERVILTNGDIVKSTINGNTNNPNSDMTGWVSIGNAGEVESVADLLVIPNPKNGSHVFVKSIQKWYTYNTNLTTPENNVTIVGKWEMDMQEAYYASWFATPEQNTDESAKIRTGYAYATSKKRPFIIDAHYYVDSSINSGDPNGNPTALKTLSNSVLWFTPNGKLEHLPTSKSGYNIIHTMNVENYIIYDPVLVGERNQHSGTSGEWGYLLTIYQSKNGYIHRPRCSDAWGDGIYIGKAAGTMSDDLPTNITVFEPIIENCRRNGISFTAGDNVQIIRPVVSNTNGVSPEAGIDVEPEEVGAGSQYPATIRNSIIESPTFINNVRNIWVSWYGKDRYIDIRFAGVTKIIGGNYPLTVYASSFADTDKQSGSIYFECIDYTCTNSDKKFETELMFEDRGASVEINKLIIRNAVTWTTHFVRFGTLNKALSGLSVDKIESKTLTNADFATTSVQGDKSTLKPKIKLGFSDSVLVMTNQYNDGAIIYGAGNIGGYSYQTGSSSNSYNYPSNNIVIKPLAESSIYLGGDNRKLKVSIDANDTTVNRTLYIHSVDATLPNGINTPMLTLQGKGAYVELENRLNGVTAISGLYGLLS